MVDLLDSLIVVFDGNGARFFKYRVNGRLSRVSEMESGLHRFTREFVSDRQGQSFSSAAPGVRHAYESKSDPQKYEKHEFVRHLVKLLDDAYDQGAFKQLVLVAPERSIGEFRALAPAKLSRIAREVPKELAQLGDTDVEARLRPILAAGEGPERE